MKFAIRLWSAAVDLLLDAVLGLTWFVLVTTLLATSLGTVPAAGVGVVLLIATTALARGVSAVERARASALLDVTIPTPHRRRTRVDGRWRPVAQAFTDLADPTTWRLLVHTLVSTVLGWGFLGIVLFGPWVVGAAADGDVPGLPQGTAGTVLASIVVVVAVVLWVWGAGTLDRYLAPVLLGRSRTVELEQRVDTLADARQGAVDAAAAERRRIERDLHDGVQPRLVTVAMKVGMARSRLDADPEAARALLDQAHREAKDSITELRQLARGIHPAVLTDRGLDAALSAVASRTPVETSVRVDLARRLSPELEAVLYFAVTEALTNVTKHADASRCQVVVEDVPGGVRAVVTDDGRGGADRGRHPGGGLSGMHDRVRSAGGTLRTDSPVGGPTIVTVEVPCAS